ncbi:MAG TPA: sodium:proton antiporter [Parasulfuritortus sp.]
MSQSSLSILLLGALGLVGIGVGGLVLSRNLYRLVLALAVAETGGNLLLVLAGFRPGAAAPIIEPGRAVAAMVDPVPQAMVLTSIVIGVGVQAFALGLAIRARAAYGSLDMDELRGRMEADIDAEAGAPPAASQHAPAIARLAGQPEAKP